MFDFLRPRLTLQPDALYHRPAHWSVYQDASSGDWTAIRVDEAGAVVQRVRLSPKTTGDRARAVVAALTRAYRAHV
jgi:hypothetical protein